MKKVLAYYNFSYPTGGGEYLPLSFLASLAEKSDVTLAVDREDGLYRAIDLFGIRPDLKRMKTVRLMPEDYSPHDSSPLLAFRRSRILKRLAKDADTCVSFANIMDFGKPGHHFMTMVEFGDPDFTDFAKGIPPPPRLSAKRVKRFVSGRIVRPLLGMRSKRSIILDPRERIYPNSFFVDGLMKSFYGEFPSSVFYPPTVYAPSASTAERNKLRVVCICRISPEKRLESIVRIVEAARRKSGLDFELCIAGPIDRKTGYTDSLRRAAAERPWLKLPGALFGEEKDAFLQSGTFAIHAGTVETFGIAVSEYLKAGLVALAPDKGGAGEVVGCKELVYGSEEEASATLCRLAEDGAFLARCREKLAARAEYFSKENYFARQEELIERMLSE